VNSGKPDGRDREDRGRQDRKFPDICLLEQPFIRDPERTVSELVTEAVASSMKHPGASFVRFQLGEAA
jgi:elongation factor Ts